MLATRMCVRRVWSTTLPRGGSEKGVSTVATGRSGSRTLARGLNVLRAIGDHDDGATVAQLSSATGLDRAVLYRLLGTLLEDGHVTRDERTRRYHLGVGMIELGTRALRGLEIRRVAAPALRHLGERIGEVACLTVRDRVDAVVVDRVDTHPNANMVRYDVGFRHPLYVGAHGRALLAHLPEATDVLAALPTEDARTITAHLRTVVERGFSSTSDEIQQGYSGVAAAVLGRGGRPIGAIGVFAPTSRLPDPGAVGLRVARLAQEVSRRLTTRPNR